MASDWGGISPIRHFDFLMGMSNAHCRPLVGHERDARGDGTIHMRVSIPELTHRANGEAVSRE